MKPEKKKSRSFDTFSLSLKSIYNFFQNKKKNGKVRSRSAVVYRVSAREWFLMVRADIYFLKVLDATAS